MGNPANASAAPNCPKCGAATIRRPVRRGPRAGLEMWGCGRYPDCTGAINIDPEPPRPDPEDAAARPAPGDPGSYLQARFERERQRDRLKRRAVLPLYVALSVLGMAVLFFALQPFGMVIASLGAALFGGLTMFFLIRMPFDSLIWAKGIEGERKVAAILEYLEAAGFITLYNRRVPGAKGDIDAIAVGPTGVWVIEAKNWSGRLEIRNDRLWVGEHDRTWAVEQLMREALAVQVAIGEELTAHRVTVVPVLCAVGGVAGGERRVAGVLVADDKNLSRLMRDRAVLFDTAQVLALARAADARLRQNFEWESDS